MEGAAAEAEPELQLATWDPLSVLTGEMLTASQCGRVSRSTLASVQTFPIGPSAAGPLFKAQNDHVYCTTCQDPDAVFHLGATSGGYSLLRMWKRAWKHQHDCVQQQLAADGYVRDVTLKAQWPNRKKH